MRHVVWVYALAITLASAFPIVACASEKGDPQEYFPDTAFSEFGPNERHFTLSYASKALTYFSEPILWSDNSVKFAARLLITSSFNGSVLISVQQNETGGIRAQFKRLSNMELRQKNHVPPQSHSFVVGSSNIENLKSLAITLNLWSTNSLQDYATTDGSLWMLELKSGPAYHATVNQAPSERAPIHQFGKALLNLAGIAEP